MRLAAVAGITACLFVTSGCSRAKNDNPPDAERSDTLSAQTNGPSASSLEPWRTNINAFVQQLYECVRRCPIPAGGFYNPGAVLEHNPWATILTYDNGREYGMFDGDTPAGKTTQGEINRMIRDGNIDWTAAVLQIADDDQSPGEKCVIVALPKLDPLPLSDWSTTYGIQLWVGTSEVQRLGIRTGSVVRFTGNVGKKASKEQGNMSGVTALHALKGTTNNIIRVSVDHETARIVCVREPVPNK